MAEQLVLVVDDDDANRVVLQEILADAGYRIAAVASPSEARELVRDERPALVILDGSSPTEKAHAIDLSAEIPAIVVSAGSYVEREADRLRARAWLRKPFEIDDLLALVREHAAPASGESGRAT
jgi:CheY-like chemotaxis protein